MQEMIRQLHTIRDWQRHLLPRHLPHAAGWNLAAHYASGPWPGGDYYDFLTLPDGRVLLLVADASDQGAPAAALMAMVRVVLHSCPLSSGVERLPFCPLRAPGMPPPHVLLGHLNRILAENSLEEQFLTTFCGVLDPADGNFHYANAGHPFPRLWRADAGIVEPLRDAVGLPSLEHDRRPNRFCGHGVSHLFCGGGKRSVRCCCQGLLQSLATGSGLSVRSTRHQGRWSAR
jgi:serine phosphatase RsbU (regulator of sigma subunit)